MRYLGLGALASFVAVSFVACSGLRQADPEPDAALPDGEAPPDGAILEDGAVAPLPDGAKPDTSRPDAADTGSTDSPADVACVGAAQDAWSRTTKITPGCADRRVFLLEGWATGGLPYFARALSIARASNGRVGVAVNGETGPEEGTLRIRTFTPTTATFASQLVKIDPLNFENVGAGVRIASGNDDTFHLVYQRDSGMAGGPVMYRRLPANNTFTAEQQLASVGYNTRLGLAVSPANSDVLATVYTPPTATVPGKIDSYLRPDATQTFGTPVTMQGSFARDGVTGNGQHVIRFDPTGAARGVYHLSQTFSSAVPRFIELAGGLWRMPKTVDNNTLDGMSGYSIDFVMVGQTKHVAYYARKFSATTAELRIATFVSESDTPTYDIRDQGILSPDPTSPQYALALGVDGLGLLHLVHVRPTSATKCTILYSRQTRKAGVVRWLEDLVAADLDCQEPNDVAVAMTVDGGGRPHIAYATASGVYYATRFDR